MSTPPTDFLSFSKRAAGRRRYNQHRQFLADLRLRKVIELLSETGPSTPGYQTIIARKLGVDRSTICRDMARLWREFRGGREATDQCRAEERRRRSISAEDELLWSLLEVDSDERRREILGEDATDRRMDQESECLERKAEMPGSSEFDLRMSQESECTESEFPLSPATEPPADMSAQVPRWLGPPRTRTRSRVFPDPRPRR